MSDSAVAPEESIPQREGKRRVPAVFPYSPKAESETQTSRKTETQPCKFRDLRLAISTGPQPCKNPLIQSIRILNRANESSE